MGVAASDRKLLWGAGILLVLLLTAMVLLAPPGEQFGSPIPSTYSAESGGAEAAYTLLSNLHYPVSRWEATPMELPDPDEDENFLLILAEPTQPPSEKEKKALLNFVQQGGHVLFAGSNISTFFHDAAISSLPPDPIWKKFSPNIPTRLTRGAQKIVIQPQGYWENLNSSQLALYGGPGEPAVVCWSLGKGQVLWWTGSTPLTNAGITKDDNLTFFLNAVADWSRDEDSIYEIYWDEYFHGQRSSLLSYVRKTSLIWGLAQLGILAFAIVFTFSRRSGPVFVPRGVSRLSPLEFVDTLGGLYERAGAASSAVAVSYQRLRSLLTRQLGLPGKISDAELAQAAEQRLGWKDSGLAGLLERAEAAGRPGRLPGLQEALGLVQKLEQHAARLQVRSQARQEKN